MSGDESRKFSRDVVWNIAGLGVAGVCGIALNFLIGLSYGSAALGSFNQVFAAYILLSQLASFGAQHSVLKYVAATDDELERRAITTAALILASGCAAVATAIFVLASGPVASLLDSPDTGAGMIAAAPGLFFFALNKLTLGNLNGRRSMGWFAVFQGGRFALMLVAFLAFWQLDIDGAHLPALLSVAELVVFLVSMVVARRDIGRVKRAALSRWLREHVRFGGKSLMSGMLAEINTRVDILMLGAFASDALVGAYSLASILAESLGQLGVVLRNNYNPILVRLLGDSNHARLKSVIRRGRGLAYLGIGAAGAVAVLGYSLLVPLLTSDPLLLESWKIFAILVAGVVVASGYLPFQQLLIVGGLPGWHTIMTLSIVAFNVAANAVLIVYYADIGAAVATAMASAYSVVALKLFVWRKLELRI